jgi:integrase
VLLAFLGSEFTTSATAPATVLLTAGIHPKVVQELLGRKTVATTLDNYSHVLPVLHGDAIRALDGWLGEAPTL